MTGLVTAACCVLLAAGAGSVDASPERVSLRAMSATQAILLYDTVLGSAPGATITASPAGDAVILEDSPARVSRFRDLITWLDRPGPNGRRIYARPIRHRAPSDLLEVTRRILGDTLGRDVALAADDRSAHLVVRARPEEYASLDRLWRRLDVAPRDERRIFVLPGRTSLPTPGR